MRIQYWFIFIFILAVFVESNDDISNTADFKVRDLVIIENEKIGEIVEVCDKFCKIQMKMPKCPNWISENPLCKKQTKMSEMSRKLGS